MPRKSGQSPCERLRWKAVSAPGFERTLQCRHPFLVLQEVFERCYDTGPYQRRVRYGEAEIVPPLAEEHAQWAAELLKRAST
ncbi:MAG: DUF4058 family protein [Thermoguttaceae bacterium]|nr:DUF4058 family protein [Thermoguttaceae bacterium]